MDYSAPTRRRVRAAMRWVGSAPRLATFRDGVSVSTYWWDGHPNFGDALTPWLLPRYGLLPIHREPAEADLAAVGSILEFLDPSYGGVVLGSGLMTETPHLLPHATHLAVRGHLTRALVGAPETCALGDPGILVGRFIKRPPVRWRLGLVPHGHHRSHPGLRALASRSPQEVTVVNVHRGVAPTVRHIASCDAILTTSLHGLITADSYGIPAVWIELEPALTGGAFKFRDYESVITPGRSRRADFSGELSAEDWARLARPAPADTVASSGAGLEAALGRVAASVSHPRRFPAESLRHLLKQG